MVAHSNKESFAAVSSVRSNQLWEAPLCNMDALREAIDGLTMDKLAEFLRGFRCTDPDIAPMLCRLIITHRPTRHDDPLYRSAVQRHSLRLLGHITDIAPRLRAEDLAAAVPEDCLMALGRVLMRGAPDSYRLPDRIAEASLRASPVCPDVLAAALLHRQVAPDASIHIHGRGPRAAIAVLGGRASALPELLDHYVFHSRCMRIAVWDMAYTVVSVARPNHFHGCWEVPLFAAHRAVCSTALRRFSLDELARRLPNVLTIVLANPGQFHEQLAHASVSPTAHRLGTAAAKVLGQPFVRRMLTSVDRDNVWQVQYAATLLAAAPGELPDLSGLVDVLDPLHVSTHLLLKRRTK